ncbi:MAG: M48 family metallopeptidase [Bacteroidales bacterium]|nr:M48 family metallopeptidase [Bacteroidales bacterium]
MFRADMQSKIVKYDNGLGEVTFTKYPQSRSIRVMVSAKGEVKVTLPPYVGYEEAERFLFSVGGKIVAQRNEVLRRLQSAAQAGAPSDYQTNKLAHKILPQRTRQMYELMTQKVTIRNRLGIVIKDPFRYNRVAIKDNSSNWGSCSTLRNINLNMKLVRLPEELMDYVIAHELCHLVYPNHSTRFHALLNAITDGKEKTLAARLKQYKL